MTKEDKEFLLKDISARLPHGIYANLPNHHLVSHKYYIYELNVKSEWTNGILYCAGRKQIYGAKIEDIQLYLRPMSSMTEEEKKEYQSLQDTACSYHYEFGDIVDDFLYFDNDVSLDYLNSIHVDYRGLIDKGLALEAPTGMYNN